MSVTTASGGSFFRNFGWSLTGKALLATRAGRDDDASFAAGVTVAMCGGVPLGVTCTAAGTNDTSNVIVQTSKPDGTAGEAHAFYITVF